MGGLLWSDVELFARMEFGWSRMRVSWPQVSNEKRDLTVVMSEYMEKVPYRIEYLDYVLKTIARSNHGNFF